MKNIFSLLFFFLASYTILKGLDASVEPCVFLNKDQHYVEVSIYISGKSIHFAPDADSAYYKAAVDVMLSVMDGNKTILATRLTLNSPSIKRNDMIPDLISLERLGIPTGQFTLKAKLLDLHREGNQIEFSIPFTADLLQENASISDIQFVREYERVLFDHPLVKNGIYMEPLPYNFYSRNAKEAIFYFEVYNTNAYPGDDYALRFYIEYADRRLLSDEDRIVLIGHRRQKPSPVNPSFLKMDITKVPSGNYHLVVEVRDRNNEIITRRKKYFQRSNPFLEIDLAKYEAVDAKGTFADLLTDAEVDYSLEALLPRIGSIHVPVVQSLLKNGTYEMKRNYVLSYWVQHDAQTPYKPFREYMQMVNAVNKEFSSSFYRGFQSDRGIIYLRYGPPNDIHREESDPAAPPYEIWTYENFSEFQSNAKFIFYNPSLAVNEYQLLHSTARGEHSDPDWQRKLYRHQLIDGNYIDDVQIRRNFGSQGGALFGDF